MTPIRYRYAYPRDPLPDAKIESIILEGIPKCWTSHNVRLGQIGDRGAKRPEFQEFKCEMEEGLLAYFRVQDFGIDQRFSQVPIKTHPDRQSTAFAVSATIGAHLYPLSAIRIFDFLGGRGSLTAAIDGEPFLLVDMQDRRRTTKAVRNDRSPTALAEAYLFDYLNGAGQRIEAGYLVDEPRLGPDKRPLPRRIRSQYQHEAYSFTEDRRLQVAFSNTDQAVTGDFWEILSSAAEHRLKLGRLRNLLGRILSEEEQVKYFNRYAEIIHQRTLGRTQVYLR